METQVSKTEREIEIDTAICRAMLYSALALGFRPPTEETITRLTSEEGISALADAAAVLDAKDGSALAQAVRNLPIFNLSLAGLSSAYRQLFGHTARGAVPPYESEYGSEALFQQPQELGDLMGFYLTFGLKLNETEHERPDHVSCECEFLSFLALKEAYALENGDRSMLDETRKATRLFLRDHLGRFAPAFAKRISRENPAGFYGTLGELCYAFVSQDCARIGVSVGPENLTLRPADDDRVPMACDNDRKCNALTGICQPEEDEN